MFETSNVIYRGYVTMLQTIISTAVYKGTFNKQKNDTKKINVQVIIESVFLTLPIKNIFLHPVEKE